MWIFTVICDPPCIQGACVANDTCNCAEGYIGERCTQPGTYVCIIFMLHSTIRCYVCTSHGLHVWYKSPTT